MLSIKDSYAFYHTSLCLLSNVNMITIKYNLIPRFKTKTACFVLSFHSLALSLQNNPETDISI